MRFKFKLVGFVFALFLAVTAILQSAEARTLKEIRESGFIRICTRTPESSPLGIIDANGIWRGYDQELANRLAADLGVRLESVHVAPSARIAVLDNDEVDIMLDYLTQTRERDIAVDFAAPYMKVFLGVVSPKSAPLTSEDELIGKRLVVVKGTTAFKYLQEHYLHKVEIIEAATFPEAFEILARGEANGLADGNIVLIPWAHEHPDFVAGITKFGRMEVIAPAVRKGNVSLLLWLNDEIIALGKERFFSRIFETTLRKKFGEEARVEDFATDW